MPFGVWVFGGFSVNGVKYDPDPKSSMPFGFGCLGESEEIERLVAELRGSSMPFGFGCLGDQRGLRGDPERAKGLQCLSALGVWGIRARSGHNIGERGSSMPFGFGCLGDPVRLHHDQTEGVQVFNAFRLWVFGG